MSYKVLNFYFTYILSKAGADPGFPVGGALKKIVPSGGSCENFWGISCEKSRFYSKKSYFFPILGDPPPLDPPLQRHCPEMKNQNIIDIIVLCHLKIMNKKHVMGVCYVTVSSIY